MQVTMSMEEYKDLKSYYENEIYKLEKELYNLREEFNTMARQNVELLLKPKSTVKRK